MGTNKCASQSGMTAYGTRRHLYDPKNHILPPMDHCTISLQMGTNKCASQVGPAPDPRCDPRSNLSPCLRESRLNSVSCSLCMLSDLTTHPLCASVSPKCPPPSDSLTGFKLNAWVPEVWGTSEAVEASVPGGGALAVKEKKVGHGCLQWSESFIYFCAEGWV